ncbi:HNH endonuclease signature motif containing protein [Actinotalea sp. JY-7876]|uniref:HNH endonuclease signature motif containing protein n=1 Tax=Actinotalea sp. JY-7876 TaxID=2758442 RepID=UPI0015F4C6C3|nr:HNH endonuclease signature motif containing protein [Actinotalea sp. JY-7876]
MDPQVDAWLWAVRHPLASELAEAAPGVGLAERLAGLEPADVDEAGLVEALAAWERVVSWAVAGQARVIAELASRERGARGAFLAEEVAVALSVTRRVAEDKVALAVGLERIPAAADALAGGRIDARRATVVCEELARVPDDVAQEVSVAVLPGAVSCTAPQLRVRLRRLELRRDPDGAQRRHVRAREQRRVELHPAPDAMAWLSAYLPADEAVAIHTGLTALAGDASPGDERTLDQRRADALVDVTTRWLDAGVHPDGAALSARQGRLPHLAVTASAATLLGLSQEPGELGGYGPIPPQMVRRIAARATWEPLLADAWTGAPLARSTRRYAPTQAQRDVVALRDATCTFPGCRMPAARCDIDHVVPYRPDDDSDDGLEGSRSEAERRAAEERDPGGGGEPRGDRRDRPPPDPHTHQREPDQTSVDNLQALCRHHHRAKTHAGWTPHRDDDGTTLWRSPTGRIYPRAPEHEPPPVPPRRPTDHDHRIELYPPPPF